MTASPLVDRLAAAIAVDDSEAAAHVLGEGCPATAADPADPDGRPLLDADRLGLDRLHRIRQAYHRLGGAETPTLAVRTLAQDGLAEIDGFLPPARLATLREELARSLRRMKVARLTGRARFHGYDTHSYWDRDRMEYVWNDGFAALPSLAGWIVDSELPGWAAEYLGPRGRLKRAYVTHYPPAKTMSHSQFGWHHDMEDRQLKLMILLTGVDADGQAMEYVRGSHRERRPYEQFLHNRADPGAVAGDDILRTEGVAGDAFLFDSNGAHRGTRATTAARQTIFVEFTTDRNANNVWGTDADVPSMIDDVPEWMADFVAVEPKWRRLAAGARRDKPTWAHSLPDPSAWV